MSDDDLARVIDGQIADALNYTQTDRAKHREAALDYFNGKIPELPPVEGRSKIVSRDVADLHGLILPSLLRVFFRLIVSRSTSRPGKSMSSMPIRRRITSTMSS